MAQPGDVFLFLPWSCRFSLGVGCSPGALGLPEKPQNELLHSWKSPYSRICSPLLFPHAHKPWRNQFGPCGQSSLPAPQPAASVGKAGRAQ